RGHVALLPPLRLALPGRPRIGTSLPRQGRARYAGRARPPPAGRGGRCRCRSCGVPDQAARRSAQAPPDPVASGVPCLAVEETAQRLDRGLRLLQYIADAAGGLTVTEAAARLGVGRAVVYRLAATLVVHGLVRRDKDGRLRLGPGVLRLARRAQPLLADAALPA